MNIQEIGIVIDLSLGTFNNTIYKDSKLQLTQLGEDSDGNPVYADYGFWESREIIIQDKIRAFKNLVGNLDIVGDATYKAYTCTSADGFSWGEYVEVSEDGTINSQQAKYAKIKIEIFPSKLESNFYLDRFNEAGKYDNEFVNSSDGVLELKRNYQYEMDKLSEDSEGSFHITTIQKSKLKKIDSIKLVRG